MDLLLFINYYLIPGIILGSIYACGAIGITLIFGILRFAHLAHGDMATLSAFIALFAVSTLGMPLWLAFIACVVVSAIIAYLVDSLFYDHLKNRASIVTVMSSLGIALMVRSLVQVIWGTDPYVYVTGITRADNYFGLLIKSRELWTIFACLFSMLSLSLFLKYSKWGKAMRATSNNRELSLLCGIDAQMIIKITWLIVGVMIAISGFFLGLNTEIKSMMGWYILLPMFAGAILGGVGKVEGAIVGGMIIGIIEETSILFLPASYKTGVAFAILILVLIVKPTGIFKGKVL